MTTLTAAAAYTAYTASLAATGMKPKAFSSFKNKAAIVAATPTKIPARLFVKIERSLTKVQRNTARRMFAKLGLDRPTSWVGATVPVAVAKAMHLA